MECTTKTYTFQIQPQIYYSNYGVLYFACMPFKHNPQCETTIMGNYKVLYFAIGMLFRHKPQLNTANIKFATHTFVTKPTLYYINDRNLAFPTKYLPNTTHYLFQQLWTYEPDQRHTF